jgi:branched-chain amino acid transport system permease protein
MLQHLANGVSLGSLYALIAIGYTMVYGILRLINFAHGDIFMMALYFAFFGIAAFHLPWPVAFVMVILATTLLGMAIERTAYKPLRDAPKNSILISAIGVSFLLENFATYVFSGKPKTFPGIAFFSQFISLGGVEVPWINLYIPVVRVQVVTFFIPVVTIIFLAVLLYIINHTKLGMSMRAVSKDYETASVMGIDVDKVITSTFAIGSGLAAIGAVMWGVRYPPVWPMMGVMPGLKCFIAAVVGGIGNVPGAVLGGFILGMGEILLVASLPSLTGYRDAFAFILLILILLFRPTGILGEKTTEKV